MKGKNIIKEIRGIILTIIVCIIVLSIINTKVFAMAKVQQRSMENTLYSDETLIVDKLSYNFVSLKEEILLYF